MDVKEVLAGAGSQVRRRRPKRDRLPLKSVIPLSDVCDFVYLVLNKNRIVIKKKNDENGLGSTYGNNQAVQGKYLPMRCPWFRAGRGVSGWKSLSGDMRWSLWGADVQHGRRGRGDSFSLHSMMSKYAFPKKDAQCPPFPKITRVRSQDRIRFPTSNRMLLLGAELGRAS